MEPYLLIITIIGLAALTMAWLPTWLAKVPLSYSILFVVFGYLLYQLPLPLPEPDPLANKTLTVRLTEIGVIITLMGTGIKINRAFSWKNWKIPFLLIFVTMILCIAGLSLLSWWWLGLAPVSALLLGAAMAPTDPVLAADVQVGPPSTEKEDHVRFSLTAEAGMNDGMAFPFTWLAIVLAISATTGEDWFWSWLGYEVVYKIVAGVGVGYFMGRFLAHLVFRLPEKSNFPATEDGFVAIAATLLVYGLTEIIHGYGFIAVFITGLTLGHQERTHELHRELHDFTDQMERLFLVIVLILLGGSIATGLLNTLTIPGAMVGLLFVLVLRPLFAYLTIWRQKINFREKIAISFFGIRGIGSFYYLAFAVTEATFPGEQQLWSIAGFIVLISVLIHGIMAYPVMSYLDRKRTPSDLTIE
ncbi:cation:proton antiporter [Adhaeribacter swui]|uniref:Cation:proton antiporter n=1 Tax=Adhaeribacter swui TaxID=2086471 RepID=A0A7G7G9E2_9BACT|nr:cation:proton antiporter [Adhaeribacter swui]QNF33776.1 cation:proton antiporter [Adhaeribacter swui]